MTATVDVDALGSTLASDPVSGRVWRMSRLSAPKTLQKMRTVARSVRSVPIVWQTADAIVSDVDGTDVGGQLQELSTWLTAHTRFVRDPAGLELLRSPDWMLRDIATTGTAAGDCDDIAMLSAALALSLGIPAHFVAESFQPGPDAPFEHVYTIAQRPDGVWVHLDVQRPADVASLPQTTRRIELEV